MYRGYTLHQLNLLLVFSVDIIFRPILPATHHQNQNKALLEHNYRAVVKINSYPELLCFSPFLYSMAAECHINFYGALSCKSLISQKAALLFHHVQAKMTV